MTIEADTLSSPFYIDPRQDGVSISINDIRKNLEQSSEDTKIAAMKDLLEAMVNCNPETLQAYGKLLMTVIRFVVPSNNHLLKKLSQLFWEIIPTTEKDGSLRQEMILACNALRNDLIHPNEYVRGSVMRSLAKIDNRKVIEPLAQDIMNNFTHSHPYVRRNAVVCTQAAIKRYGTDLFPHALEKLEEIAQSDRDEAVQNSAFIALSECAPVRAFLCLTVMNESCQQLGSSLHISMANLVADIAQKQKSFIFTSEVNELTKMAPKETLISILINLVDASSSPSVTFQIACALLKVAPEHPVAVKMACRSLAGLLVSQADNNVKVASLQLLLTVSKSSPQHIEMVNIDILRVLSSPSLEVRELALQCVLPTVAKNTAPDVMQVLKKELLKTLDTQSHGLPGHRHMQKQLLRAVRTVASSFPEVALCMIDMIMLLIAEPESPSSVEVALLLRELVVSSSEIKAQILERLTAALPGIVNPRIYGVALWIVGELLDTAHDARRVIGCIYSLLDPLHADKSGCEDGSVYVANVVTNVKTSAQVKVITRTVILPDGTYGTQNVYETIEPSSSFENQKAPESALYVSIFKQKDRLLATVAAVCLTKLCLRCYTSTAPEKIKIEALNESVVAIAAMARFYKSFELQESDVVKRLVQCMKIILSLKSANQKLTSSVLSSLSSGVSILEEIVASETYATCREDTKLIGTENSNSRSNSSLLRSMLGQKDWENKNKTKKSTRNQTHTKIDLERPIIFRQLNCSGNASSAMSTSASDPVATDSVDIALRGPEKPSLFSLFRNRQGQRVALNETVVGRSVPLSSYGDPVYVEAATEIVHLNMVIQLLIVNQTNDTLQNVAIELSAHGDLRVIDKPTPVTLAAGGSAHVSASIKLNTTESGVVFGYASYEKNSAVDKEFVVLNELPVDIRDCLVYSWMSDSQFRSLWTEFEWENKIALHISTTDPMVLLKTLMRETKATLVGVYDSSDKPANNINTEEQAIECCISLLKQTRPFSGMANTNLFAINLCSRSILGEDALMNVSVERVSDCEKLIGSVRIRSRSQGIALSLGDRIGAVQKLLIKSPAIISDKPTANKNVNNSPGKSFTAIGEAPDQVLVV